MPSRGSCSSAYLPHCSQCRWSGRQRLPLLGFKACATTAQLLDRSLEGAVESAHSNHLSSCLNTQGHILKKALRNDLNIMWIKARNSERELWPALENGSSALHVTRDTEPGPCLELGLGLCRLEPGHSWADLMIDRNPVTQG